MRHSAPRGDRPSPLWIDCFSEPDFSCSLSPVCAPLRPCAPLSLSFSLSISVCLCLFLSFSLYLFLSLSLFLSLLLSRSLSGWRLLSYNDFSWNMQPASPTSCLRPSFNSGVLIATPPTAHSETIYIRTFHLGKFCKNEQVDDDFHTSQPHTNESLLIA